MNRKDYITIFILTVVLFFCAALAFSQPPPKHIRINGHDWRLRAEIYMPVVSGNPTLGYTYCNLNEIIYDPDQHDIRNTIIHELLHAGTCKDGDYDNTYWNSEDEDSHVGIYRLAKFLSSTFHDNPKLAVWLGR